MSGSSRVWGESNPGSLWESRENLGAAAKSRARARSETVLVAQGERWGFEGGVVPQAAEEPGRPTSSYREGFGGMGDKAKVGERWLVYDFRK